MNLDLREAALESISMPSKNRSSFVRFQEDQVPSKNGGLLAYNKIIVFLKILYSTNNTEQNSCFNDIERVGVNIEYYLYA